jgi:predicted alpha-1,2-mannosidase
LYFVAEFDQPFAATGTWHDAIVQAGGTSAHGGTTYGKKGFPPPDKGSGAWVSFAGDHARDVTARVGISYVSLKNARANLNAEIPNNMSLAQVRRHAAAVWDRALGSIAVDGGTPAQRSVFYTALYHVLLQPTIFSDADGEYRGFDQKTHRVAGTQKNQYANFSGWDVYRSQLQLVTWLMPQVGSDIAQSLYNQARQNHGEWDRWTHNSGGTHVMSGDPSVPALADIAAFGGNDFDLHGAYASLKRAATIPTTNDLSDAGCNVECVGERPSLDQWLKLHYIASKSHAWGGAGETLEDASADFALAQLAQRAGDETGYHYFLTRAGYWRNLFNPRATPEGGYIQNRDADGSWPAFTPATDDGFVEASASVYLWMVPFDVQGLFDVLGGHDRAVARLDAFFHQPNGSWALTNAGPLHAELNNEPSVETPWLYDYAGKPWQTQKAVRIVVDTLWKDAPDGIPGNDDLGEMSSWYVWAALGMYPEIPGRAELLLGSPLFPHVVVHRSGGDVTIDAADASADTPYVQALQVDGKAYDRPWLTPEFAQHGGRLQFTLGTKPDTHWGANPSDVPPSFPPPTIAKAKP